MCWTALQATPHAPPSLPPLPHDAAFHRQTFCHRVDLITRTDSDLCLNFTSKLKYINTDTGRLVPASTLASASSSILQLMWPHLRPLLEKKEYNWTTFFYAVVSGGRLLDVD